MSLLSIFSPGPGKVDFMIAGVQKCGTSSLAVYLNLHPALQGGKNKEVSYFSQDVCYARGEKWYHGQFEKFGKRGKQYFDATPAYLYLDFCAERIKAYNPDMKFIVMVREPAGRAFSAYKMFMKYCSSPKLKKMFLDTMLKDVNPEFREFYKAMTEAEPMPSFESYIDAELPRAEKLDFSSPYEPSFIRRGLYAAQLKYWYGLFPKESFRVFEDKELEKEPVRVLNETCTFLGVEPFPWEKHVLTEKHNASMFGDKMNEATAERLRTFFRPHNEEFFSMIGKRYAW